VLKGSFATLVVADADGFVDAADEDFAVADVAGACGVEDGPDDFLSEAVENAHGRLSGDP
jgi:hypothetical protein